MAAPLESIVKQLADSGIIAPGKLENFVPPKAHPASADELVAELVKNHHLTQFQATQVKAGKAKALIMGEYTILDKIGAGGMGQVFKAVHRRMDRTVAIKMLPPAMTKDAAALARFEREVRAAAKLSHQNIVAAHDAGQSGAAHFLVMEYVDGKDLSATVKQDGPLPVNKAVNYILQAARGLEYAHGERVVHRDIKPANLLLDKKGIVKILDMGLARIDQPGGGAAAELTGTGTIMGTVDYMSPEQALNTKSADERADIYSLGMSLYYLLAGKAAYAGDSAMEKLMAHQTQPIPSLQDVQTTVPKQLDAIFKKMVAKAIEQRYQTMSDVVEALEGLGYGGSSTMKRSEVASTVDLSSADRKRLAKAKKQPLSSITDVVASEKSKNLIFKIVGGSFGTIVAPILVFYLIRHLEKEEKPANSPVANVAGDRSLPSPLAGEASGELSRAGPGVRGSESLAAASPSPGPLHDPLSSIKGEGNPKLMKSPFNEAAAKAGQTAWAKHLGTQVETTNSVGMRMTLIPPGEFLMGSTPEQVAAAKKMGEADKLPPNDSYFARLLDEMPQHRVTISQPFLIGTTEVTAAQFRQFVEASNYVTEPEKTYKSHNSKNPGKATTDDTAVTQITWNDAVAYCAWLSEQEQRQPWYRANGKGGWRVAASADGYRLPTEAEWEYACRAGTTTQFSFGDDKSQLAQYGWFTKNSDHKAQPVAMKLANPFGLFDMHGNAYEWCQDFYEGKWYGKSTPNHQTGPSSGGIRVLRGGSGHFNASLCRSAYRAYDGPSYFLYKYGFRVVRPLDGSTPDVGWAPPTIAGQEKVGSAHPTKLAYLDPAFQQWVKATQALPAEKQLDAVSKKLMELNPGFDGMLSGMGLKGTPKIEQGIVTELAFKSNDVTDLSPVRALTGLKTLNCDGSGMKSKLSDLSPLDGMQLTSLSCSASQVSDLTPLKGMALTALSCHVSRVADLSPIQGMPLIDLNVSMTAISDLSPLKGMKLIRINCGGTNVKDISVLRGMPLETLNCYGTQVSDPSPLENCKSLTWLGLRQIKITAASVTVLQKALPNCNIDWDEADKGPGVGGEGLAKPWNTLAFQQWVADTQKLPAEKQIEAVSKKLMELNPGFDGVVTDNFGKGTPKIEHGVVTKAGLVTDNVTDISPLQVWAGLKTLNCAGSASGNKRLSDLSPLKGMQLTNLTCGASKVSDLSPLRGMPLTDLLCGSSPLSDLSPLKGMPLKYLNCGGSPVADLSPLQGMPLAYLDCYATKVSDLSPLQGLPLTTLSCVSTKVADLSPLQGMRLANLYCYYTPVSDLSPLAGMSLTDFQFTPARIAKGLDAVRQMKSLKTVGIGEGKTWLPGEFWKKYDAGEFGKPVHEAAKTNLAYLDPAFQQWIAATQALPAEKQIEAVSKKLMELNPGFNGGVTGINKSLTPKIENGVVTEFGFVTDKVTDISPVRALAGLKILKCVGSLGSSSDKGILSDLSPLAGMQLTGLWFGSTQVSDLSPLEGMPLASIAFTPKNITKGLEVIRQMKSLKTIGLRGDRDNFPPADFWKKYDAGEFGKPAVK